MEEVKVVLLIGSIVLNSTVNLKPFLIYIKLLKYIIIAANRGLDLT